jgi:hypothetical protein
MKQMLLTALLAVVAAFGASTVRAQVRGPRVFPSQMLTLTTYGGTQCGFIGVTLDHRQSLDGTQPPFVIPAGMVFVLTGMDWVQLVTAASTKTETLFLHPMLESGVIWPIAMVHANGAGEARAGGSQAITGVVFRPGQTLCVSPNNGSMGTVIVLVHGYLAADR